MKFLVHFSRIVVGALFIFSGFIKLNDPIGFSYKLQEYFAEDVFNMLFLDPYALGIAIFIVVLEVVLGVFLLIGYKPKFTVWSLLALIVFFTFLTFYAAYFEKVKDCGCFGDFLKLTSWESFTKDAILLVFVLILFFGIKYIEPLFGKLIVTIIALLGFIASLGFGYYVLMHLPVFDFRAYNVGSNIAENMTLPEDAQKADINWHWKFNIKGEEKVITTKGAYPDVKGKLISYETETIKEADEPLILDFSIETEEENLTTHFLSEEHLIMVVSYSLESVEKEGLKALKATTDNAIKKGYTVIGLTASGTQIKQQIKQDYNLNFDFYLCDEKALKTVVRANPGILKLNKGTIIQKVHWNDVGDIELSLHAKHLEK